MWLDRDGSYAHLDPNLDSCRVLPRSKRNLTALSFRTTSGSQCFSAQETLYSMYGSVGKLISSDFNTVSLQ